MDLTQNFTLAECCKTSKALPNTPSATITAHLKETCENMAQPLRDAYGKPVAVNSGYRSEAVNRAVGGAANSAHKYGYALDTVPLDRTDMAAYQSAVLKWAKSHQFDQVILERVGSDGLARWLHIGWRRGDGSQRRQVLKTKDGRRYETVTRY